MTNSGFRCLMLVAVAAAGASLTVLSVGNADEVLRPETDSALTDVQTAPAVEIVPGIPQVSEALDVVIAPAGQATEENDVPILVGPQDDQESGKAKADTKPAKPSVKTKPVAKKKKSSGSKRPNKPAAAPMAKETASEKARAEWKKKRFSENATPNTVKATAGKAAQSTVGDKKRVMMANGPLSAGGVPARASTPAESNTGQRALASALKDSRSYREIYNSIPFSRAEYNANPAYRHQATMEIMLGQLHPIVVAPPAPLRQKTRREITVRFLPAIRPGYRPYSQYPWH